MYQSKHAMKSRMFSPSVSMTCGSLLTSELQIAFVVRFPQLSLLRRTSIFCVFYSNVETQQEFHSFHISPSYTHN